MAPAVLSPSRKLTDLEVGATARMLDAAVDTELRTLLRALGLTDNSPIRVCKRGEPCVVQVRATRIGISRRIAQHITVVPDAVSAQATQVVSTAAATDAPARAPLPAAR